LEALLNRPELEMHWLGHRLAMVVLPVLFVSLAAGCTQNPSSQFHTYQSTEKPAADQAQAAEKLPGTTLPVAAAPVAATKGDSKSASANVTASGPPSAKPATSSSSKALASVTTSKTAGGPAAATKGTPMAGPSTPRKVEVLIPNKTFRPEGDPSALRVSYDDIDLLKVLNMDPVLSDAATYMPAWLKALDGRRIRIRGFMYPTFQQTGVHAFGLARDNQICCFGRNPKIYDVFDVVLHEGTTTNYIPNRPFDVVGVFHIRPEVDAGQLYRLYEMDDATVMTK
jgi:hypothetical protein